MNEPTRPPIDDELKPTDIMPAADEYTREDDDDEEGDASGEGGGDSRKYKVMLEPLVEYAANENLPDDEKAQHTLNRLDVASMSLLVKGASGFASENDLSRKTFMAKIGMVNGEITARDIAHPKLFHLLDARAAERRLKHGIKTLDEIVSGAISSASAAIKFMGEAVSDALKDKKEERKASRLVQKFDEGRDTYALDADDYALSSDSLDAADFPVQDAQGDEVLLDAREQAYDEISRQTEYRLKSGEITLAEAFDILADIMPADADELIDKIKLKSGINFDDEDTLGHDHELNPMGG